jgi:hypothetical protein
MSLGDEGARGSRPFPDPEHSLTPRKPRTVGGAVYLAVLAATCAGLGLVALDRWQLGLTVIGVALLCGAFGRLVIPRDNAGMLGMRPKAVDVLILGGLGAALIVLASIIPIQPPL